MNPKGGPIGVRASLAGADVTFPYTVNWFSGVQYAITPKWVIEGNYSASRGIHLYSHIDRNRCAGCGVARLSPYFSTLEWQDNAGDSMYHGGSLILRRLFSRGLSAQAVYTIGKTIDSFAAFSRRDAATLRRWHDEFVPIVAQILAPEARSPPLPPEARRALLSRTPAGRRLLEVSALSPLEFVEREFEHPTIKAGLLFFNGLREVDLRLPGFGHHIAALLASPAKAQMARGGSAALARALEAAVRETGGEIRLNTEPARIVIDGGRAVGIETYEGELIHAKHLVASSLNPHQTFLDLIDERFLPREIRERARAFRYNLLAPLFAVHLNLAEPPRYRASAAHPELAQAFMVILGLDHVDQFGEIVRHHEAGTIPPPVMWGACPTLFDESQAPPGRHTAFTAMPPIGTACARRTPAQWSRCGKRTHPTWLTRSSIRLPVRRSTSRAISPTCARAISLSARSPTIRSAITARSPARAPTARICRAFISAAPAAIPAATSPVCPPTTPRK